MTKEEIGDLIEQLQSEHYAQGMDADDFIQELINRAVAIEREACAEIAENWRCNNVPRTGVAQEIRKRGEA